MYQFSAVLIGVFALQMGVALFLMFGHRGVPLHRRALAALGSAGMAISLAAIMFAPRPENQENLTAAASVVMIVLNVALAIQLVSHFRNHRESFSCLGTVGRLIGCAAVAWGVFALLTFGIVLMMGLVSALS